MILRTGVAVTRRWTSGATDTAWVAWALCLHDLMPRGVSKAPPLTVRWGRVWRSSGHSGWMGAA